MTYQVLYHVFTFYTWIVCVCVFCLCFGVSVFIFFAFWLRIWFESFCYIAFCRLDLRGKVYSIPYTIPQLIAWGPAGLGFDHPPNNSPIHFHKGIPMRPQTISWIPFLQKKKDPQPVYSRSGLKYWGWRGYVNFLALNAPNCFCNCGSGVGLLRGVFTCQPWVKQLDIYFIHFWLDALFGVMMSWWRVVTQKTWGICWFAHVQKLSTLQGPCCDGQAISAIAGNECRLVEPEEARWGMWFLVISRYSKQDVTGRQYSRLKYLSHVFGSWDHDELHLCACCFYNTTPAAIAGRCCGGC